MSKKEKIKNADEKDITILRSKKYGVTCSFIFENEDPNVNEIEMFLGCVPEILGYLQQEKYDKATQISFRIDGWV